MLSDCELDSMRATAATAMPDTATITRSAASGTLNESTGVWTPAATTTIYTGRCRVRPVTSADQDVVFGDTQITKQRYLGSFPHTVSPQIDDVVTVTSSSDPTIDTRSFKVVVVSSSSWLIDRKVGLEVVE